MRAKPAVLTKPTRPSSSTVMLRGRSSACASSQPVVCVCVSVCVCVCVCVQEMLRHVGACGGDTPLYVCCA
jgi:hypothetical protein